jgi:IS1 family transposase
VPFQVHTARGGVLICLCILFSFLFIGCGRNSYHPLQHGSFDGKYVYEKLLAYIGFTENMLVVDGDGDKSLHFCGNLFGKLKYVDNFQFHRTVPGDKLVGFAEGQKLLGSVSPEGINIVIYNEGWSFSQVGDLQGILQMISSRQFLVAHCYGCFIHETVPSVVTVAQSEGHEFTNNPSSFTRNESIGALFSGLGRFGSSLNRLSSQNGLPDKYPDTNRSNDDLQPLGPFEGCVPMWRVAIGFIGSVGGVIFALSSKTERRSLVGIGIFAASVIIWASGHEPCEQYEQKQEDKRDCSPRLHVDNVPQQLPLTSTNYWDTVIVREGMNMANVLDKNKQVQIISALAEGSGIRQIERMTGVHRDTIMRLGVRVGKGCQSLLDSKMRELPCQRLQFDEIWGFIGKKEKHVRPEDDPTMGDVWTFCAIDSETKLVPAFKVGKRDAVTANAFVADVASRMRNRVQISSDALGAYVEAVEQAFGGNVDFAQIIKTYVHDEAPNHNRRYSAPEFVVSEKRRVVGHPNMRLASTSHIERLNGTTRLHMRRLTRLTYAFSKKRENFEAATALHFAYYNFVKRHITLRATPAMAAGIERDFWTVGDLVGAAA